MDVSAIYEAGGGSLGGALPTDLKGACRALEQEFARLVFSEMRQAMVPQSATGSAGFARETTESLLDSQWAELASQGEGLGLWRSLCRQLETGTVKSGLEKADEGSRTTNRKEAGYERAAAPQAPGARSGSLRVGAVSSTHAISSGRPRPQAALGAQAGLGGGEGK